MRKDRRKQKGFTLIELLVVIAIIGIIAGIASARFANAPRKAREAVLKTNLATIRDVIDQYFADKRHYPFALEDLVDEGYLRTIPVDPMTGTADDWELIYSIPDDLAPEEEQGIFNVKSGSSGTAMDGSYYADW